MKFKELFEAEDLIKKYEVMYKHLPERNEKYVKQALEDLSAAVDSGVIYNVTFNDIKQTLSGALENSLEAIEKLPNWDSWREQVLRKHFDIHHYVQLNQTGKQIRAIKVALADSAISADVRDALKQYLEVNEAAAEIKKLLDGLKSKVIKGRKPAPVDPNAFVSKMGSKEAQKLVMDAIKSVISKKLDEWEKAIKEYFEGSIKSLASAGKYELKEGETPTIQIMLLHKGCFDMDVERPPYSKRKEVPIKYLNLKVNAKGKKFPAEEAKAQRDGLEQNFLSKNIKKLSHLVELKGNLDKIEEMSSKPVQIRSGSGTLEVGFKFLFKDGSEFKVINKIVTKYSFSGKWFEQYPTTFHDVIFPDKTRMKLPSEEKMIKEFGAKREAA